MMIQTILDSFWSDVINYNQRDIFWIVSWTYLEYIPESFFELISESHINTQNWISS